MTTDKRGVSALVLQRQLGPATIRNGVDDAPDSGELWSTWHADPLRCEVEVDETWVGGTQAHLQGSRQLKGRKAALVACRRNAARLRDASVWRS